MMIVLKSFMDLKFDDERERDREIGYIAWRKNFT